MEAILLAIGALIGSVATHILYHFGSGHGYFVIKPINEDEGTIQIELVQGQTNLMKKKRIILENRDS